MYQQVVAFAHAGQPGGVLPSGSSVPVHMHGNGPASGMMQAAMQGGMMSAAMQASTAHAAMPHGTVIHFVQAPGEASALRPHHHHANLHPFQAMHPQIPTSMPKAHMVALAPAGSYSYLPGAMDPSQDASLRPPVA